MEVFASKTTICAGFGAASALKQLHAHRLFVVTDPYFMKNGVAEAIAKQSGAKEFSYFDRVAPDPSAELVASAIAQMEEFKPDLLIAIGGGSAMDCAKAAIYLWGKGIPMAAIPTTSGSGSEVTDFAIITAKGIKQVLVDASMQPKMAILDGDLLKNLPPALIADAGFDILSHDLESLAAKNAGSITTALAKDSFCTAFNLLERSFTGDATCRLEIHKAATMAGMAFSSAGLGLCHALSHALGGLFHIPHGRLNAIFLPAVVDYNKQAAASQYAAVARAAGLGGTVDTVSVRNLRNGLCKLRSRLNLPGTLAQAGVSPTELSQHREKVIQAALADPCCSTNPVPVDKAGILEILRQVQGFG